MTSFLKQPANRAALALTVTALILAGCSFQFTSRQPTAAGVYLSPDGGETWSTRNFFVKGGSTGSITGINIRTITLDPQDHNALYLTTNNGGLLYSFDQAQTWQQAAGLSESRVESVAVDPRNKCVVYAAVENTISKSVDCNRTWGEVYVDTRADKTVTSLAVDSFNNLVVYAGNTAGDVLKSDDGGSTWRVVGRHNNKITQVLIEPSDTRIVYAATERQGIFKTTDGGSTWDDVNDGLSPFSGSKDYRELILDPTRPNGLLLASKHGLLKSSDGGATWEAIPLITPPGTAEINAVAIDPATNRTIYYSTASTFYKTTDGGANWVTRRLPTSNRPETLVIDPRSPNLIYMGVSTPEKN